MDEQDHQCTVDNDPEAAIASNAIAKTNKANLIPLTHAHPTSTSTSEKTINESDSSDPPVKLLHPLLLKVPIQIRFAFYGFLNSLLFMVAYNMAVESFQDLYTPSTIYAAVYVISIPVGHLMISCLVFGWPKNYFASLMSNVPVGLTAIMLGSYLTAKLDQMSFNSQMEDIVRSFGYSPSKNVDDNGPKSEFYSSMLVLIVTSFWTFVLSVLVNAPTEESEKKEL